MAESTYNPFTGFASGKSTSGRGGGPRDVDLTADRMAPVDWSTKKLVPGKWKVVDVSAIRKAACAKSGNHANDSSSSSIALTEVEAEAWRQSHHITVSEPSCPAPLTRFELLSSCPRYIQAKLKDQGFAAPTPIQAQSWPILLTGRDLVGIARTGSGKTLAFIVPALAHIAVQQPMQHGEGPICVVLAPTRELAQQIEQETIKVLPQNIRCGCIYGGSPKGPQLGMLRQGIHILVATPGRLIDFLTIRRVNLFRVTYLVLDEADRMLDMGFEPQVRAICGQIRPDRQTLMFSATWPTEIQRLAASFQRDFVRIHIGSTELLANTDVTQNFVLTQEASKLDELKKLLQTRRNQRVLVFCKTKKTADYLEFQLKRCGVDTMAIHGDKEQRQREFILERFRRDSRLCVVATDVAARGLDIKELETVINYDFPMQIDDYVHRIGRTGRAGAKGEAFTFITRREDQLHPQAVRQLISVVERAHQAVPDWLREWGAGAGGTHTVLKRNRNMMGGFASSRGGPTMRMPGDYNNSNSSYPASSFDARGHTHSSSMNDNSRNNNISSSNSSGGGTGNARSSNGGGYFGLDSQREKDASGSASAHYAFGVSARPQLTSASRIESKRFDTSSDDEDGERHVGDAAKRSRV